MILKNLILSWLKRRIKVLIMEARLKGSVQLDIFRIIDYGLHRNKKQVLLREEAF